MAPPLELRTYHEGPALYRFLQSSDFCNRISLRYRGGFVVTVAAISTISPGVPSARSFPRHQSDEVSGRSVRKMRPQMEQAFAATHELQAASTHNPTQ